MRWPPTARVSRQMQCVRLDRSGVRWQNSTLLTVGSKYQNTDPSGALVVVNVTLL